MSTVTDPIASAKALYEACTDTTMHVGREEFGRLVAEAERLGKIIDDHDCRAITGPVDKAHCDRIRALGAENAELRRSLLELSTRGTGAR